MENKKKLAIASLVLSIVSLLPLIIVPASINGAKIFIAICIFISIIAIILGFLGKNASKKLSIAGIVIAIISCFILSLSILGITAIEKATDCVDNGDGTSTCNYLGEELIVDNSLLTEEQMNK